MSRIRIAVVVEGQGEEAAVRTLLVRVWMELLGGEFAEVLKPVRARRNQLTKPTELERSITLALGKLSASQTTTDPSMILVMLDADDARPCELGPQLLELARQSHAHLDVACVVANVEYETWFVAAAESLSEYLNLVPDIPASPESTRSGKGWIKKRFLGAKYSETIDQVKLTAKMDLALCRSRAPSFDKLCRELEKRMVGSTADNDEDTQ